MRNARLAGIIVIALALTAVPRPSQAAPIALGSVSWASTFGYASLIFTPDGMAFDLSYGAAPLDCAGCDVVLALGATGVFDFDSTNDAQFAGLVAHLTNGIDEGLLTGISLYSAGSFLAGGGQVPLESSVFPGNTDFAGHTIDFVRLEILSNVITAIQIDGVDGIQAAFSLKWTVFGDDPTPVAEPGTSALLAAGVLAAVRARRRRRV
jgi:MYXO-CTERM domain-containing protein